MEMAYLEEWKNIFVINEDVYIYGAKKTAEKMYEVTKKTGVSDRVKGFVVSSVDGNPLKVKGLLVKEITEITNRNTIILCPFLGVFWREVKQKLDNLGFVNYVQTIKYIEMFEQPPQIIDDIEMKMAKELKEKLLFKRNSNNLKDEELKDKIRQILNKDHPDFGGEQPYQSLENIDFEGRRPTLYRIFKYGLFDILDNKQKVLDIGCNTGFLDMMLADYVKSAIGVEYDESLVSIANMVREYLGKNNCTFTNEDFMDWTKSNRDTFDVVFSFAVHHWLNVKPEEYATLLDTMVSKRGFVCIESHIKGTDTDYEKIIQIFKDKKYEVCKEGTIKDDGITEREFILFKK